MTHSILEYYKTRKTLLINEVNEMHEQFNWTQEMIDREEVLNKKKSWIMRRISNIEDMIEDPNSYHDAYLRSQY